MCLFTFPAFAVPTLLRTEGWLRLNWRGWPGCASRWFTRPKTVTHPWHPGTNWVTMLIETKAAKPETRPNTYLDTGRNFLNAKTNGVLDNGSNEAIICCHGNRDIYVVKALCSIAGPHNVHVGNTLDTHTVFIAWYSLEHMVDQQSVLGDSIHYHPHSHSVARWY